MRRILIATVLLILIFNNCYSQQLLGKTKNQAKKEIINSGIKNFEDEVSVQQENGYTKYCWNLPEEGRIVGYYAYFNKNGVCIVERWFTFSSDAARIWVGSFNTPNSRFYFYTSESLTDDIRYLNEETISAKLTLENNSYLGGYNLWFFKMLDSTDVLDFFELHYGIKNNASQEEKSLIKDDYQANKKLLSEKDLFGLSKQELRIMRNEIYARRGYIFKSKDLREYFSKQTWYIPQYEDVTSFLTPIELENIEFIKKHE